ncbi:cyclic nucleotide-binding domain-containing protein [Coraliomargarita akajimensis]|nr:cyclic nucleotide-binding domain-containing protein [Coraliomargarita akajimensis]
MLNKIVSSVFKSKQTKEIKERLETVLVDRVSFLRGADDSLIAELAGVIEPVHFESGATIFNEGEAGDSFYILVEGSVRVSCQGEFIGELGVGGCFGEGVLLNKGVRVATAVAVDAVTLYQIGGDAFVQMTEKYNKVRYRINKLDHERRVAGIKTSIERNLLEYAPFFAGASQDLIQELAEYFERRSFAQGDELVREGEIGESMFFIEEGFVGISKGGGQIAELGAGACFGEGALISPDKRSATAVALTVVSCFELQKSAFNRIVKRYPVWGGRVKAVHAERA